MSLRGKIVALFLGLAVAPLLVVAGFGYWQATQSVRQVMGRGLDAAAAEQARQLEEALSGVEQELAALAEDRVTRELLGDSGSGSASDSASDPASDPTSDPASDSATDSASSEAWAETVRSRLPLLAYATVDVSGRGRVARVGSQPNPAWRCTAMGGAGFHTVSHTARIGADEVRIEGGVWLDDLVAPDRSNPTGSLLVYAKGRTDILFSTSCEDLDAGVPPALAGATAPTGRIQVARDEEDYLASFATLPNRDWAVAARAPADAFLVGPLRQLQMSYWIFVLTLTAATVLAFSLLLGRVVRSLEDLTAAAGRIGEGDLNPWLPPPGGDEVGRLSLAFSGMLERVRRMVQKVDHSGRLAVIGQLTSYLAHEIRNPLSSIRMNLQGLQRGARAGRIPPESREAIEISLREVDRLSSSLTNLLQLGRPASGERETVSLHEVVEDAADLLAGEFRRGGVQLVLDLDSVADRVRAAPGQLKGVFLNLLMNALEAQEEGGRVDVRSGLASSRGRGPMVAVHVRDHGRGVDPELRQRIFEPFYSTKAQGSGIGLAVALRTVREHGGDLFLSDLPETSPGTEFVVELPLAALAADTVPEPRVGLPEWMGAPDGEPGGRVSLVAENSEARRTRPPRRDVGGPDDPAPRTGAIQPAGPNPEEAP